MGPVEWGVLAVVVVLAAYLLWERSTRRDVWTEDDDEDARAQAVGEHIADLLAERLGLPRDHLQVEVGRAPYRVARKYLCRHWRCRARRTGDRIRRWWRRVTLLERRRST